MYPHKNVEVSIQLRPQLMDQSSSKKESEDNNYKQYRSENVPNGSNLKFTNLNSGGALGANLMPHKLQDPRASQNQYNENFEVHLETPSHKQTDKQKKPQQNNNFEDQYEESKNERTPRFKLGLAKNKDVSNSQYSAGNADKEGFSAVGLSVCNNDSARNSNGLSNELMAANAALIKRQNLYKEQSPNSRRRRDSRAGKISINKRSSRGISNPGVLEIVPELSLQLEENNMSIKIPNDNNQQQLPHNQLQLIKDDLFLQQQSLPQNVSLSLDKRIQVPLLERNDFILIGSLGNISSSDMDEGVTQPDFKLPNLNVKSAVAKISRQDLDQRIHGGGHRSRQRHF
ncbi:hypothetical protein FGO68_gene6468 [Halteria grandinella]|uniref:Uncharacterized protein n=1 Tax=Halteria grandinella TaxID=5974 RepID=A0A8J8T9G9_HALGN|nr:hypothetical protein FGO68_gene6468 [Halteria grandinella]